jgi:uncharacterized protein YggE
VRTLTTTGHGTVDVAPDAADVRVAAAARAGSVLEAVRVVDEAVRLVGTLARDHTEGRDIASSGLSVWPQRDRDERLTGYQARHSLVIRSPDLTAAGRLLGRLVEEVGDRLVVEGVSLVVTDRQPHEDAAREAAWADARRRAGHLAALAGSRLAGVAAVAEGSLSVHLGDAMPTAVGAMRSSLELSFEGGEQSVATYVTVTWEIVD